MMHWKGNYQWHSHSPRDNQLPKKLKTERNDNTTNVRRLQLLELKFFQQNTEPLIVSNLRITNVLLPML